MKKLILLFIFKIFVACYMGLACKQPVQLPFECLSDLQKKVHYFLCRQATQVDHGGSKNYFTAALVFYFKDNVQPLVLWISSGKEKENEIKTNGCFISGNIATNAHESLHNTLNEDFGKLETSLNTYISRDMQKVQKAKKVFTQYRLTDSEMKFLHEITFMPSHTLNQYIGEIKKKIKGKLQCIELHGFTTRDMCPCCFQHLQNFLTQANTKQNEQKTFFGSLLTQLNQQNIPISFFISSLVELGHTEYQCSRYPSYYNTCKEKIAMASTPSEKTMHCVFLRKDGASLLSFKEKKQDEQKNVISNANTIFSKSKEIQQENLKPGVEQMQLNNFKLKKGSEGMIILITDTDLGNINLGTQPVSQTPATFTFASQQFILQNVPGDGNCGVWAFLQACNPSENFTNPTKERIDNMIATRQKVADLAKTRSANATTQLRIATDREWLSTDDFRYFAQYANQDIVVIIDNGNGNYQHETYYADYPYPNGDNIIAGYYDGLPGSYDQNTLYIYYRNGHFQTLLLEPSLERGGEAI